MRDSLASLTQTVESMEQRLKQFEDKNNTSTKRKRKAKVSADIKVRKMVAFEIKFPLLLVRQTKA